MRRGQITMFIILGLALLLIVGLVILLPGNRGPSTLQAKEDVQTVTNTVQQCLSQVGEQSIREVGRNGGYANLTLKDTSGQAGYTRDTQVIGLGMQKLPLWHEMQTPARAPAAVNDHRPALCAKNERYCPVPYAGEPTSIQEGVELLVEQRITDCLNGFSNTPQLAVEYTGRPDAHLQIREDDAILALKYPMQVTAADNQRAELETFSTTLDVKLPRLYRLARKIQKTEYETQFLEESFLHLLSIYQGINSPLPPIREIQTSGDPRTWTRTNVQRTIEQDLMPYLQFIQVINAGESYAPLNTDGLNETYRPYADGIYDYMTIKVDNETYPLGARFEYPNTPVYLNINDKEYLQPRSMGGGWLMKLVGMNMRDYRHKYSVSFPMVVHLDDPAAFSGTGYEFSYAMEANIRNNLPLNASRELVTIDFAQETLDLSDESQLVNHTYTVRVKDNRNDTPVAGANIVYACGGEFAMGKTDFAGTWRGKLPYCITGGHLIVDADGYARGVQAQENSADDGASSTVVLGVWPLQRTTVNVYKLTERDVLTGGKSRLTADDAVIMQIFRNKETAYDAEIPVTPAVQFGGANLQEMLERNIQDVVGELDEALAQGLITREDYNATLAAIRETPLGLTNGTSRVVESYEFELAPGTYAIEGTLMYAKPIQIPEMRQNDIVYPSQTLSSWMSGGVILTGADALTITPGQLYGGKNLTLYVLEQPLPNNWTTLIAHRELADYQQYGVIDRARPVWE